MAVIVLVYAQVVVLPRVKMAVVAAQWVAAARLVLHLVVVTARVNVPAAVVDVLDVLVVQDAQSALAVPDAAIRVPAVAVDAQVHVLVDAPAAVVTVTLVVPAVQITAVTLVLAVPAHVRVVPAAVTAQQVVQHRVPVARVVPAVVRVRAVVAVPAVKVVKAVVMVVVHTQAVQFHLVLVDAVVAQVLAAVVQDAVQHVLVVLDAVVTAQMVVLTVKDAATAAAVRALAVMVAPAVVVPVVIPVVKAVQQNVHLALVVHRRALDVPAVRLDAVLDVLDAVAAQVTALMHVLVVVQLQQLVDAAIRVHHLAAMGARQDVQRRVKERAWLCV